MENETKTTPDGGMNLTEKTLSSECVYDCGFLRLMQDRVELPDGSEAGRCYVKHPGGVCVAPIDENGNLIMVRQYRYPLSSEILELPAGKIDPGESPEVCGRRELLEETGFTAEKFTPLGVLYPTPGYTNEGIYMFLAEDLIPGEKQPDEGEFLETVSMPFEKAVYQALTGSLNDAKTVICLARADYKIKKRNK